MSNTTVWHPAYPVDSSLVSMTIIQYTDVIYQFMGRCAQLPCAQFDRWDQPDFQLQKNAYVAYLNLVM